MVSEPCLPQREVGGECRPWGAALQQLLPHATADKSKRLKRLVRGESNSTHFPYCTYGRYLSSVCVPYGGATYDIIFSVTLDADHLIGQSVVEFGFVVFGELKKFISIDDRSLNLKMLGIKHRLVCLFLLSCVIHFISSAPAPSEPEQPVENLSDEPKEEAPVAPVVAEISPQTLEEQQNEQLRRLSEPQAKEIKFREDLVDDQGERKVIRLIGKSGMLSPSESVPSEAKVQPLDSSKPEEEEEAKPIEALTPVEQQQQLREITEPKYEEIRTRQQMINDDGNSKEIKLVGKSNELSNPEEKLTLPNIQAQRPNEQAEPALETFYIADPLGESVTFAKADEQQQESSENKNEQPEKVMKIEVDAPIQELPEVLTAKNTQVEEEPEQQPATEDEQVRQPDDVVLLEMQGSPPFNLDQDMTQQEMMAEAVESQAEMAAAEAAGEMDRDEQMGMPDIVTPEDLALTGPEVMAAPAQEDDMANEDIVVPPPMPMMMDDEQPAEEAEPQMILEAPTILVTDPTGEAGAVIIQPADETQEKAVEAAVQAQAEVLEQRRPFTINAEDVVVVETPQAVPDVPPEKKYDLGEF